MSDLKIIRELFGLSVTDARADGETLSIRFNNDVILQVRPTMNGKGEQFIAYDLEWPMEDAHAARLLKATRDMPFHEAAAVWKNAIDQYPFIVNQREFADWAVANLVDLTRLRKSMEGRDTE